MTAEYGVETMKKVADLLPPSLLAQLPQSAREAWVIRVTSDSREVEPGTLFVAVRGSAQDGHVFIGEAARKGAVLIVGSEGHVPSTEVLKGVPYIGVPEVEGEPGSPTRSIEGGRETLARIAAAFYGHPSRAMKMIGITGTSGKTTTAYLVESILKASGLAVGLVGTVEFRFGSRRYASTHTTPGPVELQRLLVEMRADGCTAVVMEVSSHALKQHRTAGIAFDGLVFTNLSPEHLDFHPDMEDYFRSKSMLFEQYVEWARAEAGKNPVASINGDDPYGRRLLEKLRSSASPLREVVAYGFAPESTLSGATLRIGPEGISGEAQGIRIDSGMIGSFNALNILGAVGIARALGISSEIIARGVREAVPPPGRLERVLNGRGIHVFVDYAHKPDALEKILETLSHLKGQHRLLTVFGCGGDRDRTKRPVMGALAARWSDRLWVTSDNPRTEDPSSIVREILEGIPQKAAQGDRVTAEVDRRKAIFGALSVAQAGDWVLIAGKGHEDYQIFGTTKIHFDDREVAREALGA
jgi:UDP-N-acetylmuramoyl-L-alanyl-D-glutamate--2,6-diaminopimelate ligase